MFVLKINFHVIQEHVRDICEPIYVEARGFKAKKIYKIKLQT